MAEPETQPAAGANRSSVLKRVLRLAVKLALAFAIFFPPLAGGFSVFMTGPKVTDTPRDFGIEYRDVVIPTEDGLHLPGWVIPVPASVRAKGAMLLLHGHPCNRMDCLQKAQFLAKAGYISMVFDMRAHGNAPGRRATFGLEEPKDVRAALEVLRREAPGLPIGLFGQSFGAAIAILSAKRCPEVRSYVVDSPFASFYEKLVGTPPALLRPVAAVTRRLQLLWICWFLGRSYTDLRPQDALADLAPRPVFFIHGAGDENIPAEHSARLHRLYNGPKDLWLVPGCWHVGGHVLYKAEYERRVLAHLDRTLAQPGPTASAPR